MKALLFATLVAMTGSAMAQLPDLPGIPDCGRSCANGVVGNAATLNCPANDLGCLCQNGEFAKGFRECTNNTCSTTDRDTSDGFFGSQICPGQSSSSASPSSSAPPSSSAAPSSTPPASSAAPATTGSISSVPESTRAQDSEPTASPTSSTPTEAAAAASGSASTDPSATATPSSSSPNLRVILPAVLCSVVGVLLLGALIFYFLRRRKQKSSIPRFEKNPGDDGRSVASFQAVLYKPDGVMNPRSLPGQSSTVGSGPASVSGSGSVGGMGQRGNRGGVGGSRAGAGSDNGGGSGQRGSGVGPSEPERVTSWVGGGQEGNVAEKEGGLI